MYSWRVDLDHYWSVLKDAILAITSDQEGLFTTEIKGLSFYRQTTSEKAQQPHFCQPIILLILQGTKTLVVAQQTYSYPEKTAIFCGMDMPVTSCIAQASSDAPYLALTLALDFNYLAEFIGSVPQYKEEIQSFLQTYPLDLHLLDTFVRLVDLSQNYDATLTNLVLKELYYRLLKSPFGSTLCALTKLGSQENQIAQAINWLKANFAKPIAIEELAKIVHMAPSTFYKHFKTLTGVTPLQYIKRLRLNEAHRLLMLDGNLSQAAKQVGYDSLSQFIREYKRLYGNSPKRNLKILSAMENIKI